MNTNVQVEPTFDGLPEQCWTVLDSTNELVLIKRGVRGYFPQRDDVASWSPENKDALNKREGITKGQEAAMKAGSMFGWSVPGANPLNYDEEGNLTL